MKSGKGSGVGNGTSGYVTPPVGSNSKLGGFGGGSSGGSASGGTSGYVTPPVGSNGKLGGGK